MLIFQVIRFALASIWANKMRSVLTTLGIIIGIAAVITVVSIAEGAKANMRAAWTRMGTNLLWIRAGYSRRHHVRSAESQRLTLDDVDAILRESPYVKQALPSISRGFQVKYFNRNTNTEVEGSTPAYQEVRNHFIRMGEFFTDRDVRSARKVCVLGADVATELMGERNPVGETVKIRGAGFRVLGVLEKKGGGGWYNPDDEILIPITTLMKKMLGRDHISRIYVKANSENVVPQAKESITAILRKRHNLRFDDEDDFRISAQQEYMEQAENFAGMMSMLLIGIAAVSLLVGGIGIMNIMLVSVAERTREIGIRKALGAKRRHILRQFLIEAMLLALVGGALGVPAGIGGSYLFAEYMAADLAASSEGWPLVIPMWAVGLSFAFAACVGIFFGMYPAWKAARLNPIEALRHE